MGFGASHHPCAKKENRLQPDFGFFAGPATHGLSRPTSKTCQPSAGCLMHTRHTKPALGLGLLRHKIKAPTSLGSLRDQLASLGLAPVSPWTKTPKQATAGGFVPPMACSHTLGPIRPCRFYSRHPVPSLTHGTHAQIILGHFSTRKLLF
ncbi:hypothetical protein EV1_031851 [Malus domestica]